MDVDSIGCAELVESGVKLLLAASEPVAMGVMVNLAPAPIVRVPVTTLSASSCTSGLQLDACRSCIAAVCNFISAAGNIDRAKNRAGG